MSLLQFDRYIDNVGSGKILTCDPVKKAVGRHMSDIKRQRNTDFPFYFDPVMAEYAFRFFGTLKFSEGDWYGKPVVLQDHQAFRLGCLFGWMRADSNTRRFRRAYIELPRKSGKSEEAALVGNYGLIADNQKGAQVISAATSRDQARIIFQSASRMCDLLAKDHPTMAKALKASVTDRVKYAPNLSSFFAVSSEAKNLDGKNPNFGLIDEYHEHRTDDVKKVLETGMGARPQPLLYIITTAGFNLESPCYQYRDVVLNILNGSLVDDSTFGICYTLDDGDDWHDEDVWAKASPNLGVTIGMDFMRDQYRSAVNEGMTAQINFLTKNLNVWVRASKGWIPDDHWQRCGGEIDIERLKNLECYGGFDLSSTYDYCAMCLNFPEGEKRTYLWWFWLCQESYEKRVRVMPVLRDWKEAGFVRICEGNYIDQDYLEREVSTVCKGFRMVKGGCDPFYCWDLVGNLQNRHGLKIESYNQGYKQMSEPIRKVEELVSGEKVNHGNNPIMRWMMGNVSIKTNAGGGRMADKENKSASIDGAVAMLISEGVWASCPQQKKSYLVDEASPLITF